MLLLSACAKVNIKDAEYCADEGSIGADCFHTLNSATRSLDKSTWDAYRFGQVCSTLDTFSETKAELEKLCSISTSNCSYQDQQNIKKLQDMIDRIHKRITSLEE